MEDQYSTHYLSPVLRKEKLLKREREPAPRDPPCFIVITDRKCVQCEAEILKGNFLYMDKDRPLCMTCAKFDHLDYLPAGDRKLTLRATKYSEQSVVVVKFSRARNRYKRNGILVTTAAYERATAECSAQDEKGA